MRNKIIPYNPKLVPLAKELRNNSTLSEILLWKKLRRKQLMGYDFDRQKPIGNYIVDFYCRELMLALEIDSVLHDLKWEIEQILKEEFDSTHPSLGGISNVLLYLFHQGKGIRG